MKKDFDIHQWQAKFLQEGNNYRLSPDEFLKKEMPHIESWKKIEYDDLLTAMEEYADYVDKFLNLR